MKMLLHIILATFVATQAASLPNAEDSEDGGSFSRQYVKDTLDNDITDINLKVEMFELKRTLYKQGKTMEAMQKTIEKQEAKLDEKDHIIELIIDKLANTDKTVAELKSEISALKNDVANKKSQLSKIADSVEKQETRESLIKPKEKHKTLIAKKTNNSEIKVEATRNMLVTTKHTTDNHSTGEAENTKTSEEKMADFQSSGNERQITENRSRAFPSAMPKFSARDIGVVNKVAFSAYLGHFVEHMGVGHTIKCDQVLLNDGNSYSPFTGAFTAPSSGVYLLTFNIAVYDENARTLVKLVMNNSNIVDAAAISVGSSHDVMGGNTAIIRLNQGEAVWLEIYDGINSEARSYPAYRFTTFSGVLLYG